MRNLLFLFALVGFVRLTLVVAFADPPNSPPSDQTSGTHSDKAVAQTDLKNHTPKKISQTAPAKLSPKKASPDPSSHSAHLPNDSIAVAKTGSPSDKTTSPSAPSVKPQSLGGAAARGATIFRKSTGTTVSLGGLTAASVKTSTAGINGTGMQRTTSR